MVEILLTCQYSGVVGAGGDLLDLRLLAVDLHILRHRVRLGVARPELPFLVAAYRVDRLSICQT